AESDFRSALERIEGLLGSNHSWTAIVLYDLGKTLLEEQKPHQAIPMLERALRIREQSEPNLENVAETRFALARALWLADAERARALTLVTTARENYRKLPGGPKQAPEIDAWLAGKLLK